jgi:hypothetical protein
MNKIHLTGPSVRNNGDYVDAGTDVDVGEAPDQIVADRAAELVLQARATDPDAPAVTDEQSGDITGDAAGGKRSK